MEKLTLARIAQMTDEEVYALSIENPESPGQRAFSFTLRDFESRSEMAACMAALVSRMQRVQRRFA